MKKLYHKLIIITILLMGVWLPLCAQTYRIGDVITNADGSKGVVFYLHADGSGGWMVALNDASTGCTWGTSADIPTLTNVYNVGDPQFYADLDGYGNTQKIRTYQNNSTAYAAGKVDFANGWYLPTAAQLSRLFAALPFVESAISFAGGTTLSESYSHYYWTSTEQSASCAWNIGFGAGGYYFVEKTNSFKVRAIRDFSAQTIVYDTTLTYLWNTGATTPHINELPNTTTEYTVTATTGFGCSNSATQTIMVNSLSPQIFYDTVCQGEAYQANGFIVDAAQTQTAGITLNRQDTVSNGSCSAVVTLYLYISPAQQTFFNARICEGESYGWNGLEYYEAGNYTQTFAAANGCDSSVTLNLIVYRGTTRIDSLIACDSLTWIDGHTYTASTTEPTYTLHGANAVGCDSTIMLHLTINPTYTVQDTLTICEDDLPYYYESADTTFELGTPSHSTSYFLFHTLNGCDSIIILHLTILHRTTFIDEQTACDSLTWIDGHTYTTNTDSPTDTLYGANAVGCDSIVILHLTISHSSTGTDTQNTCDSLIWIDGITYRESTHEPTYTIFEGNASGCDSTVTLNLTIKHSTTSIDTQTIVENQLPYTWNGVTFTAADTLVGHITNAVGCDSAITMYLYVHPNVSTLIDSTICANALPLQWGDDRFTAADTMYDTLHNVYGADSVLIKTLTVNSLPTITFTGFTNPICPFNADLVSVNAAITTGLQPYHYVWSGDSISSIAGHSAVINIFHTYCGDRRNLKLSVTDANGCSRTDSTTLLIQDETPPTVNPIPTRPAQVSNCVFTVPDVVSLVRARTSDNCTPIDSLIITQQPAAGTIITSTTSVTVTITDRCSNHTTTSISITVPIPLVVTITGVTHIQCYGDSTGSATAIVRGGTAPYTYQWYATSAPTTVLATTALLSNQPAGTYVVEVMDANGCTKIAQITLYTLNGQLSPGTITSDQSLCYGEQVATLTGTAAPGGSNLTYQWQTSTNGTTFTAASAPNNQQNYTVGTATQTRYYRRARISAACGTVYSDTLLITVLPIYHNSITADVCQGYPYQENGFNIPSDSTQTARVMVRTRLVSSLQTGCDSIITLTLTVNPTYASYDTITIDQTDLPYYYAPADTTFELGTPLLSTTHFLLHTSADCDSAITMTLTVNYNVSTPIDSSVCENALPLQWGDDTFTSAGTMYDTLLNVYGADSVLVKTLTVNSLPTIAFAGFTNPICPFNEDSVSVTAMITNGLQPYQFAWSGDSISSTTGNVAFINIANTYCEDRRNLKLSVTDANGCSRTDSTTLIIRDSIAPTVNTILAQTANVSNCIFTVPNVISLVRAQASDNCTPTDSLIITQQPAADSTITSTTSVTVTIFDRCNNQTTTLISVTVPVPLAVTVTNVTHILCYGESTGSATATVAGGTMPYTYQWFEVPTTVIATTAIISSQPAGTYTVTVTDANGCTANAQIILTNQNGQMLPGAIAANQSICYGENVADLTGTAATGGSNPTYQWQSSSNGTTFTAATVPNNQQNYNVGTATQTIYYRRAWISAACGTVYSDTLLITVWPPYQDTIVDEACQGESYMENGFNIPSDSTQAAGVIERTRHTSSLLTGCDSTIILTLTVNPTNTTNLSATICQGESYMGNGFNIPSDSTQTEGVMVRTRHASSLQTGCDSTIILTLTVNPTNTTNLPAAICQGESYMGNGFTIPSDSTQSAGVIMRTRHTSSLQTGCDSTIILTLTVNPINTTNLPATICRGESYMENGFTIPSDSTQAAGVMVRTRHTSSLQTGCDSTIILTLTINPTYTTNLSATICQGESYMENGFNIPADSTQTAGVIVRTRHASSAQTDCDSTVILSLTINPTYVFNDVVTVCETDLPYYYAPADTTFEIGTPALSIIHFQLSTIEGCDSIYQLDLTVLDTSLHIVLMGNEFCDDLFATLSANTNLTDFVWSTGETTSEITVTAPGQYSVTASEGNCVASGEYDIAVCEFNLYLPNAITPSNGDGLNDYFCLDGRIQKQITDFEISIYNRWGQLVFNSGDKSFKWHGDYQGDTYRANAYNYFISCTTQKGRKYVFRGSVTVL